MNEYTLPLAPNPSPDMYGWMPGQVECYIPDCNKPRAKPIRKGGIGMSKFCERHTEKDVGNYLPF